MLRRPCAAVSVALSERSERSRHGRASGRSRRLPAEPAAPGIERQAENARRGARGRRARASSPRPLCAGARLRRAPGGATASLTPADREDRTALAKFYEARQQRTGVGDGGRPEPARAAAVIGGNRQGRRLGPGGVGVSRCRPCCRRRAGARPARRCRGAAQPGGPQVRAPCARRPRRADLAQPQPRSQAAAARTRPGHRRDRHGRKPGRLSARPASAAPPIRGAAPEVPGAAARPAAQPPAGGRQQGRQEEGRRHAAGGPQRAAGCSSTWSSGAGCPRTSATSTSGSTSPSSLIRVVKNGQVIHAERIVVGKADTQTPVFSDEMEQVIFHPFWGVPDSIKRSELLPNLARRQHHACRAVEPAHPVAAAGTSIPQSVDWAHGRHAQVPRLPAAGRRQCARRRQVPLPQQARRLHARYAAEEPVQRLRAHLQPRLHARARSPCGSPSCSWPRTRTGRRVASPRPSAAVAPNNQINLDAQDTGAHHLFHRRGGRGRQGQASRDIYGHEKRIALGLEGKAHLIAQAVKEATGPIRAEADRPARRNQARRRRREWINQGVFEQWTLPRRSMATNSWSAAMLPQCGIQCDSSALSTSWRQICGDHATWAALAEWPSGGRERPGALALRPATEGKLGLLARRRGIAAASRSPCSRSSSAAVEHHGPDARPHHLPLQHPHQGDADRPVQEGRQTPPRGDRADQLDRCATGRGREDPHGSGARSICSGRSTPSSARTSRSTSSPATVRAPPTTCCARPSAGRRARAGTSSARPPTSSFPDVPLRKLRYSALIRERGGVGYYPTSAIPFVHVDTDRVRAWPRLPRYELALLFPSGRTQHVPERRRAAHQRRRAQGARHNPMLVASSPRSTICARGRRPHRSRWLRSARRSPQLCPRRASWSVRRRSIRARAIGIVPGWPRWRRSPSRRACCRRRLPSAGVRRCARRASCRSPPPTRSATP